MKFDVRDIAWSDRDPADVVANINVSSLDPRGPRFSFPMEFKPYQGGWQLSARTAEVLLAFRNDSHHARADDGPLTRDVDRLAGVRPAVGDVHSLKQKRSVVRPIVAELQRKFGVSAAETGSHELHRRARIGVAMASADRQHAVDVLDAAERWSPRTRRSSCCRCAGVCGERRLAEFPTPRRRGDGTRSQPARRHQERGVAAHGVLGTHRQPDGMPAALHRLPGARLGPALLFAQRLHDFDSWVTVAT